MFLSSGEEETPTMLGQNHWTRDEGLSRVGDSPSSEDENRSSVRNVVFSSFFEYRTMMKSQKPSHSGWQSVLFDMIESLAKHDPVRLPHESRPAYG
jgi:hypothetical protein